MFDDDPLFKEMMEETSRRREEERRLAREEQPTPYDRVRHGSHFVASASRSPKAETLRQRVRTLPANELAVTAATLEEQARSWISLIGATRMCAARSLHDRFVSMFRFFESWQILPFDQRAAEGRIETGTELVFVLDN